jgi:S-adenosyl-L-methionine hydrolase (adenosine-forming)
MTVFFLSDYGTQDEFVGVVHAVLAAASPGLTIVDLTHHVPPFDVRAGSHTLVRVSPHLGPGVVLAVVDPGVGSGRRGLCLPVTPPGNGPNGPTFFVGPDNGLLIAAAEQVGEAPIARAFELHRPGAGVAGVAAVAAADRGHSFDGRDLFAPAAAALCRGVAPDELGDPIDPLSLVRVPGGVVEHGRSSDGRRSVRAEVLWIDHFGNIQLAATAVDAQAAGLPRTGTVAVDGMSVRRVETFDELAQGELGLLVDSNGHLAVVAGEAPAAHALTAVAGQMVVLTW